FAVQDAQPDDRFIDARECLVEPLLATLCGELFHINQLEPFKLDVGVNRVLRSGCHDCIPYMLIAVRLATSSFWSIAIRWFDVFRKPSEDTAGPRFKLQSRLFAEGIDQRRAGECGGIG